MGYVAYRKEFLRDGFEEYAKLFNRKEDALVCIENWANGFAGVNCEFALFELGKKIELNERVESTPQPAATKRKFSEVGCNQV